MLHGCCHGRLREQEHARTLVAQLWRDARARAQSTADGGLNMPAAFSRAVERRRNGVDCG
jgi:hypothetical protein